MTCAVHKIKISHADKNSWTYKLLPLITEISLSILANLVRHYKEKHPETEPPDHIIAAGEAALKEQQENGMFNDLDELVIDVSKLYSNTFVRNSMLFEIAIQLR